MDPLFLSGLAVTALLTQIVNMAITEANRVAGINERKSQFTQKVVDKCYEEGYNAVVVSNAQGSRSQGYCATSIREVEGQHYTVYMGRRSDVMIVENQGDGGYVNWALRGRHWVRWGNIVKFHPNWNVEGMGVEYETRAQHDFPGWPHFTLTVVQQCNDLGYNAVIVNDACRHRSQGHSVTQQVLGEGRTFTVYMGRRSDVMIVENQGDGGYDNWALKGDHWVRWGNIVKFHPNWDSGMGVEYETRNRRDFPGW